MAFGEESLDAVARKLEDVAEMQPPQGLVEKVKGPASSSAWPTRCRRASHAAPARRSCSSPTRRAPPIQHCWPGDRAPFITLPAVITSDPRTGVRNVGMYRMQKIDATSTHMHWQVHKDGRADWLAVEGSILVAVALGLDPVTAYSPARRRSTSTSSCWPARAASRSSSSSARRSTSKAANAEIVLEGRIEAGDMGVEGCR